MEWHSNYLTYCNLYQICNIFFDYIIKKHEALTDNPPIKIYVNKIDNRNTFKIKAEYCLDFWMPKL